MNPGSTIADLCHRWFNINRKLCDRIGLCLPQAKGLSIFKLYETTVAGLMNSERDQIILDVGGGRTCPFAKYRDGAHDTTIVAADVSAEEIKHNVDADGKIVADLMQPLPFQDSAIDIITSRSVLEHIESLERFVSSAHVVTRPAGYFVHLLPSKFAPFAVINQLLPNWLARNVLLFFQPQTRGINGFPARYDRCYYSAICKLLLNNGFKIVSVKMSYYQSPYFNFFVPLFLVSALYEMAVYALGAKSLGAYVLVVAQKIS